MNIEAIREYCLSKKGAVETYPFDDITLVIKVGGKMFALISLDRIPLQINLKCDPEKAIELRERHENVIPGWHMNKKYWNTVILEDNVRWSDLKEWMDHSYNEVVLGLKKSEREKLNVK
jgi:predicted DNA-binding protein (MmcQ/YjbR family)